jgi:predicted transcriptional regulator
VKQRHSEGGRGAEAIARDRDAESWRIHEIHASVAELNEGRTVPHAAVVTWLRSWV